MSIYTSARVMPYVYLLVHRVTGQFYYGYREANTIPSHLDLPKYKSSSKVVKAMGFENFDWFIIAEFFRGEDAWDFEQSLIAEQFEHPLNLNGQHRHGRKGRFKSVKGIQFTAEHRAKLAAAKIGKKPHNFGKELSAKHKASLAAVGMLRVVSDETKAKQAASNSSEWHVVHPDGTEENITNLREFCRSHGLDNSHMNKVAKGKLNQHRGYRVIQATGLPIAGNVC